MEHVIDLIRYRRSLRAYEPRPLERSQVETVLEAACYAPSGHNRQSWQFTAVLNPKALQTLNELVKQGFRALEPTPDDPVELHDAKRKVEGQGEKYSFYYGAPCLVIASNVSGYHNATADCACALENMFLTAYDLGLGACWVNQLHWLERDKALRAYLEQLGVPSDHTICGSGVFGYPGCAVPKASPRKEHTCKIVD